MIAVAVLPILLGVLAVVLVVLFLGGLVASGRRRRVLAGRLDAVLEAADAALAQARAQDRGWDRELIERAARGAYADRHPGRTVHGLQLIQVVDRPGTEADQAIVRVIDDSGREDDLTLGRRDGAWVSV